MRDDSSSDNDKIVRLLEPLSLAEDSLLLDAMEEQIKERIGPVIASIQDEVSELIRGVVNRAFLEGQKAAIDSFRELGMKQEAEASAGLADAKDKP